jgi:hypothetical protein
MSVVGVGEVEELLKMAATFPITSEIDGKIAPAMIAAKVPTYNKSLSCEVM